MFVGFFSLLVCFLLQQKHTKKRNLIVLTFMTELKNNTHTLNIARVLK